VTFGKDFCSLPSKVLGMNKAQIKRAVCVFIILVLMVSYLVVFGSNTDNASKSTSPNVYVGVDATFGSVEDMKTVIDEVKTCTNFFVIGSTAITNDLNNLTQVCQRLNGTGLQFLVYSHPAVGLNFSQVQWVSDARQAYPGFVGLFGYDEPGGNQVDHVDPYMCAHAAANYSDAAQSYVGNLTYYLSGLKVGWEIGNFPIFTSDYALYEYDYRAGYNVVLTEFMRGVDRQLSIALCRGAAAVHGADWGVIITGNATADDMESEQQLYSDMVLAYKNGAKYILVFDYPTLSQGILKQEHFDALKQFWQYIQAAPRTSSVANNKVAYVLPQDYGYGFRGGTDKIWGLWQADNESANIWGEANSLLQQYGSKLDIVYEDSLPSNVSVFSQFVFWDGNRITS
jgi:hypothetical protein